ncbi:MAG: GNAT family N-acetyltransferase [Devosiaceae bacterium]|nr:GNAT family N-acetyltransferase [Devosiaceae bacterium MH13]
MAAPDDNGPVVERLTPDLAQAFPPAAEDVFDHPPTAEHLGKLALMPGHALFVARGDGMIVGQLLAMVQFQADREPQLYIDNLGVAPALKRQGIARALFDAAMAWGKDAGCEGVWLATDVGNAEAQGFYRSLGFTREAADVYFGALG